MRAIKRLMLLSMIVLTPVMASAQAETDTNVFWDVTKAVVLDPTTYAPATLTYTSMKMDWDSSQTLFRNGWVEQNHRFTISGRPNDLPLSYADGNKKIRNMALLHLQESLINNTAANVFERVLAERYPQHRNAVQGAELGRANCVRLIRVVCRIGEPLQTGRAQSPTGNPVRVPVRTNQETRTLGGL